MIYILQDCYKDENNNYHDILKIGYSKSSFDSSRKSMYNTHNFGYKFLGEKEGSQWLEAFLHKKFSRYRLSSGEWFEYSEEIIKGFWEISEEDISDFKDQGELNEFIRGYILDNLVPSVNKLLSLYLEKILDELKEKDLNYEENKNLYRKEILDVFNFVSSKEREYFEKLDFNSQENMKILEDHNLIVDKSNKKDKYLLTSIVLFYKTIRKNKVIEKEEFDKTQIKRKNSTDILLKEFFNMSDEGKTEYIKKLKDGIKVSQYSDDFVSISSKTGLPVYNNFIEIANERAWDVSQKDYQDKINVTKAFEDISGEVSEYKTDLEKEIDDFLDNHFYKTGIFKEKMRLYCEFMDKHKGSQEVSDSLYFRIKDDKYRKYYNFFGTSGCRANSYEELKLYTYMMDSSKESILYNSIYTRFKSGDRYSKKDIKQLLGDLYRDLGISKTPKATDLGNYFKLIKTNVINPQTKKIENGFRLDPLF